MRLQRLAHYTPRTVNTPSWQASLDQLVHHPSLTPAQVRYLLGRITAPSAELWNHVLGKLASPKASVVTDAAFTMDVGLSAKDRDWVLSVVSGALPVALRARVRTLFQNGILQGRIKDEEAEVPVPAGQELAFALEDLTRELGDVPQALERARLAAEYLVGESPVPADVVADAVSQMAARLHVATAAIWAELLVHPLTRDDIRAAAGKALQTAQGAAVPVLKRAAEVLLPGPLKDQALAHAERHAADASVVLRAAVSGSDGTGAFAALLWLEGAEPRVLGGVFAADPTRLLWKEGRAATAEAVEAWAWRQGQAFKGLVAAPAATVVALCKAAVARIPDKQAAARGAVLAALEAMASTGGVTPGNVTLPAAAGTVDDALLARALGHAATRKVLMQGTDLGEKWRKELGKEMRARGRPREETLRDAAADVTRRPAVVARLKESLEHGAVLAALTGQEENAGATAAVAAALGVPGTPEANRVLRELLLRTLGVGEDAGPGMGSHRDDLRELVLPSSKEPLGAHVLQLDLAAAGWEAALNIPNGLVGLDDDAAMDLCAHGAGLAVRAIIATPGGSTLDVQLQEAAKQAIRDRAESLPSRQRRELVEAWVKAWTELLTRACMGTCNQRCLDNLKEPRLDAAFMMEHPRLNKVWP